jgi:hypothetical protein
VNGPNRPNCIGKTHKLALSIITYVGCSLSLIALVLTVVTLTIFPYVQYIANQSGQSYNSLYHQATVEDQAKQNSNQPVSCSDWPACCVFGWN